MDGPHDLGGKHGFGPIDTTAPPVRHAWEARQWALSRTVPRGAPNIDAWRHGIEQMEWSTYLSVPYFVKWGLNDLAFLVLSGTVTLDEATSCQASEPGAPAKQLSVDDVLSDNRRRNLDFSRPAPSPARFAVGDKVETARRGQAGHTRLPAYARAVPGMITAYHGAHLFPDAVSAGTEAADHLYTVAFAAQDLWGEAADPRDRVHIDLWEPYLAPL